MASPNPSGVFASSAGVAATIQGIMREAMPSPSGAAGAAGPAFGEWAGGGLLTGLLLAALFLAYFYKRIL